MVIGKSGSGVDGDSVADSASKFIADRAGDSAFFHLGDISDNLSTAGATRSSATLEVIEAGRGSEPAVYGRAVIPGFAIQAYFNTLGVGRYGERAVVSLGRLHLNLPGRKVAAMAIEHIVMPFADHLGRRAHRRSRS